MTVSEDKTRKPPAAATKPVPVRGPGPSAPAPARKTDYRLRGLDLGAPDLVEVQPRMVRKAHPSRRRRRRRLIMQWTVALLVVAASAVALRTYVVQPYTVRSTSMVPTLPKGSGVLLVRPKALAGSIKTGSIIVFHRTKAMSCNARNNNSSELISRVIGLPGQTVTSDGKHVRIDGRVLKEKGWFNKTFGELGPTQIAPTLIPPRSYFVLGDNRTDPCDSRAFGPIPASSLVGKVVATTMRNGHPHVHLF